MPFYYYERVQRNIAICRRYGLPGPEDCLLELGTGWVHWEAITLRLFFDFKAILYDVWDNRQLSALKSYVRQLVARFGRNGFLEGCDFDRARDVARKIEQATNFEHIYDMLGFRYVVDPTGLMEGLPPQTFRFIISAGVMEHIPAKTAPRFVANMAFVLKEGGIGVHSINIADHLYLYDRSANPKQYLSYSEVRWRLLFENEVQYVNLIQRCEWLEMFAAAHLHVLEESGAYSDLRNLRIHPRFNHLSRRDIDCTTLDLIVRKGAPAAT